MSVCRQCGHILQVYVFDCWPLLNIINSCISTWLLTDTFLFFRLPFYRPNEVVTLTLTSTFRQWVVALSFAKRAYKCILKCVSEVIIAEVICPKYKLCHKPHTFVSILKLSILYCRTLNVWCAYSDMAGIYHTSCTAVLHLHAGKRFFFNRHYIFFFFYFFFNGKLQTNKSVETTLYHA